MTDKINGIHAYTEGSESCRNYSRLTMRVRTLSQQVLILGAVGFLAALTEGKNKDYQMGIMIFGGIALSVLAFSLSVVDWHYQSAFSMIRDSLAKLEVKSQIEGPWRAHLSARTHKRDHVSSYLPFLLLWFLGLTTVGFGAEDSGWWVVIGLLGLLSLLWFIVSLARAAKRHTEMEESLASIRESVESEER